MIGADDVFHNSFAASGHIPDKYGNRTLLEHRSRLVSLPPQEFTEAEQREIARQADEARSDADPLNPAAPSAFEAEAALRHMGATLDAAGMASIDPRYLVALRSVAAPQSGAAPRALSHLARAPPGVLGSIQPAGGPLAYARGLFDRVTGAGAYQAPPSAPLSWHCADDRIAVATAGDVVCVYSFHRGAWEGAPLKTPAVRGITAVAFRPSGGSLVAVACAAGVALWRAGRPGLVEWLVHPGHTSVVALDWAPDGAQLVSASADDGTARVWDVGTRTSTPAGTGGLVRFCPAPGADVVLVGSATRNAFRLVSTANWAMERWGSLAGPVRAAAWAPGGRMLIISAGDEGALHVLRVDHAPGATVTDLAHTEVVAVPRVGPGGSARHIAWDPHGERVAVVFDVPADDEPSGDGFEMDEHRRYAVAVYATSLDPVFTIAPIGYIGGPPRSGPPTAISFKPRCEGRTGAVLAVSWGNASVTFTQLIFKPAGAIGRGRST